ncbi:MAG: hypothetical protein RJA99_4804 [Pseudomonadota bacterium]
MEVARSYCPPTAARPRPDDRLQRVAPITPAPAGSSMGGRLESGCPLLQRCPGACSAALVLARLRGRRGRRDAGAGARRRRPAGASAGAARATAGRARALAGRVVGPCARAERLWSATSGVRWCAGPRERTRVRPGTGIRCAAGAWPRPGSRSGDGPSAGPEPPGDAAARADATGRADSAVRADSGSRAGPSVCAGPGGRLGRGAAPQPRGTSRAQAGTAAAPALIAAGAPAGPRRWLRIRR